MNVSLLLTNTKMADKGEYECMVRTDSGDATATISLSVTGESYTVYSSTKCDYKNRSTFQHRFMKGENGTCEIFRHSLRAIEEYNTTFNFLKCVSAHSLHQGVMMPTCWNEVLFNFHCCHTHALPYIFDTKLIRMFILEYVQGEFRSFSCVCVGLDSTAQPEPELLSVSEWHRVLPVGMSTTSHHNVILPMSCNQCLHNRPSVIRLN